MRRHRKAEAGEDDRGDVKLHHQGDLDLVLGHGDDLEYHVLQNVPVFNDSFME